MKQGIGVFVLVLSLFASPAAAQNTDIEALSGLQFDFGNPGARALGMGGAFIGLADDASAAESNPAGLTILRQPEVSLELRRTTTSQFFGTGGWYPDVLETDFPASSTRPSFASVVVPVGRFALAAYYHSPLDLTNEVDITERYPTPGYFLGADGPLDRVQCLARTDCVEHRIYPYRTTADVQLETIGAAVAWKAGTFSIGASVRYHEFSENAETFRTDLDAPGIPTFVVRQQNGSRAFGRGTDDDFTWILGLKWKPSERWSIGAIYKQGPSFPAPLYAGLASDPSTIELVRVVDFNVPDVTGVGVSYRPTQSFTVNLDVLSVNYSSLTDGFASIIEIELQDGRIADVESVHGFETSDAIEAHLGLEYFFQTKIPFGVRLGAWHDPAHTIEYRGPISTTHEVAAKILFPERPDEMHYAAGFGFAWPRFQIDVAYDASQSLEVGSVSFVTRF